MSYSIIHLSVYINSWDFRNGRLSCVSLDVICGSCGGYVYISFLSILSAALLVSYTHLLPVPLTQVFPNLSFEAKLF